MPLAATALDPSLRLSSNLRDGLSMSRTTIARHPINAASPAGGPVRWPEDRDDVEGDAGKGTSPYHGEYLGRAAEAPVI